jgi:predicted DNA-binding transcriptional regulator
MFVYQNECKPTASGGHLKSWPVINMIFMNHQDSELERKLQGRTLKVYLYLQRKREPSGIREVQRELELSSPSVAEYQISKLIELGLVARDSYGRVYLTKSVKVKELESYVSIGHFTVPRLALYGGIFTGVAALYLAFNLTSLNIYGVLVPAAAAAIFWFEAVKMWKLGFLQSRSPAAVKQQHENNDFWISLIPGIAALATFLAAAFFLFYYVAPNSVLGTPAVDTNAQVPQSSEPSLRIDQLKDGIPSSHTIGSPGDHAELVSGFSPTLIAGFVLASAVVAGFLGYLMIKYRHGDNVLILEQDSDREF